MQSSKCSKTALSGVSQQSSGKECTRVFCVCQSVVPASSGLFRPRGLVQPSPAFPADSSQVRAQEPCPAAQRPRESAYHPGSFPEKLQGRGALTVPRDVPRRSTWPGSLPAYRNCAQDENTWFSIGFKHSAKTLS